MRVDQCPNLDHPIPKLWNYILLLARYDTSYDLRDRTRTYRALLSNASSTQLASLLLLAPKPVPHAPSPSESRKGLPLGSTSLVLGSKVGIGHGQELPEWVEEGQEPDPKLRDEVGGQNDHLGGVSGVGGERPAGEALDAAVRGERAKETEKGKGRMVEKSLEDWLGEEEDEEESDGEENTEEEESEYEEITDSEEEEEEEEEEDERAETKALVRDEESSSLSSSKA